MPAHRRFAGAGRVSLLVAAVLLCLCPACDSDSGTADDVATSTDVNASLDVPNPADQVATPDDIATAGDTGAVDLQPDVPTQSGPPALPVRDDCPTLAAGINTFEVGDRDRSIQLYLPATTEGAPVVFLWHGNGDQPVSFGAWFDANDVASDRGAIVVVPYDCCRQGTGGCCEPLTTWGYANAPRAEADLAVFDKTLACLEQQFDIDNRRVYVAGFSAGALWSTYLLVHRAEFLAAAAIFSGGLGNLVHYATPAHKLPGLLVSGGANDTYMNGFVKFTELMDELTDALLADGHSVVRCDHGLGHTVPSGGPSWAYEFLFAHEWAPAGSPVVEAGTLPESYPAYCGIPAP